MKKTKSCELIEGTNKLYCDYNELMLNQQTKTAKNKELFNKNGGKS